MTKVLVLANQKGGVGKTTTAINLGAALAELGQRVLLVDNDPQGNTTSGVTAAVQDGRSTYELLVDEARLEDVVVSTPTKNLWIVASSADLAGAELELSTMMAREFRLRRALEGHLDPYDFVIIDCPPSLGLLTINALAAADEVIVPVQCEYMSLEGLGQFTGTLQLVQRNLNKDLKLRGLLLTMYDRRTNLSQQVADEVRRHFPNTFRAMIPRNVRLSEAPSHGMPINEYDPRSPAADAYMALAREVLQGVNAEVEVAT
jgi:chromosome partitioning protein